MEPTNTSYEFSSKLETIRENTTFNEKAFANTKCKLSRDTGRMFHCKVEHAISWMTTVVASAALFIQKTPKTEAKIDTKFELCPDEETTHMEFAFMENTFNLSKSEWDHLDSFKFKLEIIKEGHGNSPSMEYSFGCAETREDRVLVVGGKRIYVQPALLALHSSFFRTMFHDKGSASKEIPLNDLVADQFIELLRVIYPTEKPVTRNSVYFLLSLADRFKMPFVSSKCSRFLCEAPADCFTLFEIADLLCKYKLFDVKAAVCKNAVAGKYGPIGRLIQSNKPEFDNCSPEARLFIHDVKMKSESSTGQADGV